MASYPDLLDWDAAKEFIGDTQQPDDMRASLRQVLRTIPVETDLPRAPRTYEPAQVREAVRAVVKHIYPFPAFDTLEAAHAFIADSAQPLEWRSSLYRAAGGPRPARKVQAHSRLCSPVLIPQARAALPVCIAPQ